MYAQCTPRTTVILQLGVLNQGMLFRLLYSNNSIHKPKLQAMRSNPAMAIIMVDRLSQTPMPASQTLTVVCNICCTLTKLILNSNS